MSLRDLPIRRKLTAISMLTSGVALVLACIAFVLHERVTFRGLMVRDLAILANMIGYNSGSALSFDDARSAEQVLEGLTIHPTIVAACIYDGDGKVFATYRTPRHLQSGWPATRGDNDRFGNDRLELFRRIKLGDDVVGTIYINSDLTLLRERSQRYVIISGFVMLMAAGAAYLITNRLQRVISEPISELAGIAHVIAHHRNYALRAVKRGRDELGQLIDGFNEMLAQIQSRDAALQQAHDELETRVARRTVALQREIAERRRSEDALRESHVRFEIVTRATSDVIWDWNIENDTLWLNENYQSLFGFAAADVPREIAGWYPGIHPDDAAETKHSFHAALAGQGQIWAAEYRYRRSDGAYAIVHDRGWILRDAQGRAVRMIGAMQDITARRRAEEEIAREQARFKFIFDAVPVGISLVTADDSKIHLVNPAHERITGVSAQDSNIPGVFARATDAEDYARQTEAMQPFVRGEVDHYSIEKRYRHGDGRAVWVVLTSRKFTDTVNGVKQSITTLVDITERKEAETRLAETHKKLLDSSRLAGMAEVATGVLHNVGNVLNSVNVSATLVMDRVRESKSANVAKLGALLKEHSANLVDFIANDPRGRRVPGYILTLAGELAEEQNVIGEELGHLRKNIEHIKDIVAMQQSYAKVSGVVETVAVVELVEDALRMNSSALSRHGLEVLRDYIDKPSAMTERQKVMQVLVNLIRNAKHACDESGRTDKQVKVSISSHGDRVRIAITDNGVGIPPENLTRIFAHGFTTRQEGHGFGLHSGALVARELGGSLFALSEGSGKGATFVLELPGRVDQKAT